MVTENDRHRFVSNGDIGRAVLKRNHHGEDVCILDFGDWRMAAWLLQPIPEQLTLAYAITIHKSQGSEYDTVVIPMSSGVSLMLYRNLIYTAISRAKKRVIVVGSAEALEKALRQSAPPRRSMLVTKTHMARLHVA